MTVTICVAGKSQAAVDVLMGARNIAERIVCLPVEGDAGHDDWQPSLRKAAVERGIEIVSLDWLMAQPDLLFMSVEYDRIIRPERFVSSRLFNVHFSLLPKYRGCNTAVWPILNGDRDHGVTLHEIDAGIDTGPIIASHSFPIEGLTARQLYGRCLDLGADLVLEWLPKLAGGDYQAIAQDHRAASTFPRAVLDYGWREIDLRETVERVMRRIRAFTFPEYQRPTYQGAMIVGAHPLTHDFDPFHGEVAPERVIEVEAIDGALRLHLASA